MTPQTPSGQQAVEHCPRCGSVVENAAGIGPFCPNAKCDVADNLLCVPTFSTTAPTAPSTAAVSHEMLWAGIAAINSCGKSISCDDMRAVLTAALATPPAQVGSPPGVYAMAELMGQPIAPPAQVGEIVAHDASGRVIRPPEPMMHANAEWYEAYARWHGRYIRALMRQEAAPSVPWEEQAARWHDKKADWNKQFAAERKGTALADTALNVANRHRRYATQLRTQLRALLSKPVKGEGK